MYNESIRQREEEQGRLRAHEDLYSKQEALLKRFEAQQPKHMVETAQQEPEMKIGKKRGRPKGSPNKPKIIATPVKDDDDMDRRINAGFIPMIMRDDGLN
jgi:hypothetical protein